MTGALTDAGCNDAAPQEEDDGLSPTEWLQSMWVACDVEGQTDDAPEGTRQSCYWTENTFFERVKVKGTWKYLITYTNERAAGLR